MAKKSRKAKGKKGKKSAMEPAGSVDLPQGKRNKALGARGEEAAARFLRKRGYELVAEVKTRRGIKRGFPSEAVDRAKQERYERIALAYVQGHCMGEVVVRFDVIAIVAVSEDRALVRHHRGAFPVV